MWEPRLERARRHAAAAPAGSDSVASATGYGLSVALAGGALSTRGELVSALSTTGPDPGDCAPARFAARRAALSRALSFNRISRSRFANEGRWLLKEQTNTTSKTPGLVTEPQVFSS